MTCEDARCDRKASHVPKICVPVNGSAAGDLSRALTMILGVRLCRDCCALFDPADVLDVPNDSGAVLRDVLPAMARVMQPNKVCMVEPDRAWTEPVRIDSDEYLQFVRMAGPS